MKKVMISIGVLLICSIAYSTSPLEGYVSDEKYREAQKIYVETGEGIFQEPPILSENNARETLESKFPSVISIVNKSGSWYGNFYFKDDERLYRKTIKNSGYVRGIDKSYAVTVFRDGILVRDVGSGKTSKITLKTRGGI